MIDIPEQEMASLAALCQREAIAQEELASKVVSDYVKQHSGVSNEAFGLWRGRAVDGVAYQRQLRDEWS